MAADDKPLPSSPELFLYLVAMLFVVSLGPSLVLYVLIEAPLQALVKRPRASSVTNGHVNGHVNGRCS